MSCSLRPVGRAQRAQLERLTAATGLFRPDEVAIALELLDDSLAGDTDYRLLGAYAADDLVGYACWGPTPGTRGTYDLYWIVVDPTWQGRGIGTELLGAVEHTLVAAQGRLIVVETSSRAAYAPTRAFYERRGYARTATLPGYYAPDDDLVIYLKDLMRGVLARATA
ncbi:MAG TPA: GNAT family N-acetyltransferase [Gemmatimonadales bacterium]|nr:GNAT family N-acetyltransferase [Gemmatimonadales bacterium]